MFQSKFACNHINCRSCQIFQEFSNSLAHSVKFSLKQDINWYLDDCFFVNLHQLVCNQQVNAFLAICAKINFPVSLEKTLWRSQLMVFLGLLLDTL